jgi:hypothetical protein
MVYNKTKKNNKYNRKKQTKYKYHYRQIKKQKAGMRLLNNQNQNQYPIQTLQSSSNNVNMYPNPKQNNIYNAYKNTIPPLESNYLIQRASQNPNFFGKITEIIKKGLSNAVQNIDNYVGIDPRNPNDFKNMLIAAKNTLENTTNLQELAVIGSLILEASTPFIQPAIDKINLYTEEAGEKIGKTIINVILNTAEEIPIYGIIIGTIRSIDNIIRTTLSTISTGALVVQEIRDGVQFTINEFESLKREYMMELKRQKEKSMNRIQNSIQEFNGGGYLS